MTRLRGHATAIPGTRPGGLAAAGITKSFGGVHALQGVNLTIPERTIVGLIGPNGAGKSTLLKALCGFVVPDAGTVTLGPVTISGLSPARVARAGLVTTFQHATPISGLSVLDNVLVGMTEQHAGGLFSALCGTPAYRSSERRQRERGHELLRSFGLGHLAGLDAGGLSFGQLRLLEIARAVAAGPRLLLLDEPAAGLNRVEIDRMTAAIRSLRDEHGMGVLVVDHDVPFVFDISNRITAMNFGRVIAEGSPTDIEHDSAVRSAYLSVDTASGPASPEGENR
ncbi:ABC transporter ATP-binding protein [Dactylosporangium sp. CA-092794]|uniref:ABC transporter ATP-binding protein n=1 Tax=Dactylosporangium sp. CA-092794 TaxID=3239929 RepID=UPI003D8E6FC6